MFQCKFQPFQHEDVAYLTDVNDLSSLEHHLRARFDPNARVDQLEDVSAVYGVKPFHAADP